MNKNKDIKKKEKFSIPYADIVLLSLLAMPFSMFVLDSPIMFWLSFLLCVAALTAWSCKWDINTKNCPTSAQVTEARVKGLSSANIM